MIKGVSIAQGRDHDIDSLRRAHSDAKRTLNKHLETSRELNNKAHQTSRISGLIFVIVGGFVSTAKDPTLFLNCFTLVAMFLFLLSFGVGIWLHRAKSLTIGVGPSDFERQEQLKLTEMEYLRWVILRGYSKWIDEAIDINERKVALLEIALFGLLAGLIMLSAGIYLSI